MQDRPARVVGEGHVLEPDLAAGRPERRRVGRVADLGAFAQQFEHGLHVGERALDLAVDEAEEVQWQEQLDQVGIDEHEIADRHGAVDDAVAGHDHRDGDAEGDDHALADVEEGQRGAALHRRLFVAVQRLVEAPGLGQVVEAPSPLALAHGAHLSAANRPFEDVAGTTPVTVMGAGNRLVHILVFDSVESDSF